MGIKLIDALMHIKDLPPQKKKVIAMGGVAFIVLLFVSFLLSLTEDDNKAQQNAPQEQATVQNPQASNPKMPSSQRYDFDQGNNNQGGGIENLLNDGPQQGNNGAQGQAHPEQKPIGMENDPFAALPNNRDSIQKAPEPVTQTAPQPAPAPAPQPAPAPEPAPAPQAPAHVAKSYLLCDKFNSSQEAESQKAMLAFQGIMSTVTKENGYYTLKIGPFNSSDEARTQFSNISDKGVVNKCTLRTE